MIISLLSPPHVNSFSFHCERLPLVCMAEGAFINFEVFILAHQNFYYIISYNHVIAAIASISRVTLLLLNKQEHAGVLLVNLNL